MATIRFVNGMMQQANPSGTGLIYSNGILIYDDEAASGTEYSLNISNDITLEDSAIGGKLFSEGVDDSITVNDDFNNIQTLVGNLSSIMSSLESNTIEMVIAPQMSNVIKITDINTNTIQLYGTINENLVVDETIQSLVDYSNLTVDNSVVLASTIVGTIAAHIYNLSIDDTINLDESNVLLLSLLFSISNNYSMESSNDYNLEVRTLVDDNLKTTSTLVNNLEQINEVSDVLELVDACSINVDIQGNIQDIKKMSAIIASLVGDACFVIMEYNKSYLNISISDEINIRVSKKYD